MKDYNAHFNDYLRKVADFDVRWRFKAVEIRRFIAAMQKDEEDTLIEGDFNVLRL